MVSEKYSVGQVCKMIRIFKGYTLRAAAHKMGYTHVHLHNLEQERGSWSSSFLAAMERTYGVNVIVMHWLLNGGDTGKYEDLSCQILERATNATDK